MEKNIWKQLMKTKISFLSIFFKGSLVTNFQMCHYNCKRFMVSVMLTCVYLLSMEQGKQINGYGIRIIFE